MAEFPVTNGVTTVVSPPLGYEVDFENPQRQFALHHFLISGILGSLAFLCLVQRVYTRKFLAGGLRVDDALIILAWVSSHASLWYCLLIADTLVQMASIVMQSVQTWSISIGGLCHHAWEMPIETFEKHMLSSYIVAPIFITCNGLTKTSLLTLYLRISPQKWYKMSIQTAIGMVAGYTVIIAGLLLFGCHPIPTAWDPYVVGTCINLPAVYIAIAVVNIISDVVLFVIPIPMITRLKMPLSQKIGAGLMFGVGSVTVATSIVRMVYLPSLLDSTDIPWVAAPANIWSFLEVNLFIICSSMTTFRTFLKRFFPTLMGTRNTTYPSKPTRDEGMGQQRNKYAPFDTVELNGFSHQGSGRDSLSHGTVVLVSGPTRNGVPGNEGDDSCNSSVKAILGDKSILCSRSFATHGSD